MTLEEILTAWFAAHPFIRTLLLLALGTVTAYAKKDWEKYKAAKVLDSTVTFNIRVAAWQWGEAVVLAVLPALLAKGFLILGGEGIVVAAMTSLLFVLGI